MSQLARLLSSGGCWLPAQFQCERAGGRRTALHSGPSGGGGGGRVQREDVRTRVAPGPSLIQDYDSYTLLGRKSSRIPTEEQLAPERYKGKIRKDKCILLQYF